jgi:hypothetical protein
MNIYQELNKYPMEDLITSLIDLKGFSRTDIRECAGTNKKDIIYFIMDLDLSESVINYNE